VKTLLVDHLQPRLNLWLRHLERQGLEVESAATSDDAFAMLARRKFQSMVLNMAMPDDQALNIADYAIFRYPDISIIAVTSNRFFSDGTLFSYIPNLRSHVAETVPMDDLGATLTYYASHQAASGMRSRP